MLESCAGRVVAGSEEAAIGWRGRVDRAAGVGNGSLRLVSRDGRRCVGRCPTNGKHNDLRKEVYVRM